MSWIDCCTNCGETRKLWVNPATGMHLCSKCQSNPEKMRHLIQLVDSGRLPYTPPHRAKEK